ncbi:MAG: heavy metal sensor histidine kinase [Gammaproteobacteria bacterium]|nr:heavy metal sensor histidine kinase [Gammaproteobacteria bacterium]
MTLRLSRNSIALRLCLLISLSVSCTLLFAAIALYALLDINFDKNAKQFLQNEVVVIENILQQHVNNWSALNQEIIWGPQGNHYLFLARVSTIQGQLVRATPNIDSLIPDSAWPIPSFAAGPVSDINKVQIGKSTYALITGVLQLNNPGHQVFVINVAYDISQNQEILGNIAQELLIISLVGLIVSLLFSFVLTKIGLNPLSQFVREISKIDPEALDKRIDIEDASDELKPLIDAFNHLLERIKQGYERLSDFSSNIAHELRTPVNNLMMETEVLLSQPLSEAKAKELLGSSLEEYQRLASIIDRLLFLARSDAKKLRLQKVELNLLNEVRAVMDFHEAMAMDRHIKIEVQGHAKVWADQTLLRNALANLLTNAIKYSGDKSHIIIRIEETPDTVKVAVIDNGPGIAEAHLPRLTERFYRVDSHRTASTGGSGLGLAIVHSIMESHGGRVEFQHNTPQGMIIALVFSKPE